MARTEGAKNNPKDMLSTLIQDGADSEDIFLAEAVRAKAFWSKRAEEVKKMGNNPDREKSYADAYRLLINKFTQEDAFKEE